MSERTTLWWTGLRAVSVANVVLWAALFATLEPGHPYATAHVGCSAVFTFVCAFRAFLPRVDLERTVLVDHPASGIFLGRSLATIAEMAFTVQCALVLEVLASRVAWVHGIALVLVPLIAVAQVSCWYAVLTLDHLWHAVEEALWTVMVALVAVALLGVWPYASGASRWLFLVGAVGCVGAAVLMSGIDVPMYLRRAREERAAGTPRQGLADGVRDALFTRRPTREWSVWRAEVPWMSLYFSFGVWISLLLAGASFA